MEPSVHLLKQAACALALQLSDRREMHAHSRRRDGSEAGLDTLSASTLIERQSTSQIVEAGYALNATSLQWKSLDFQFEESLLQRGAGTESLLRHGCNLHMPSSQSR